MSMRQDGQGRPKSMRKHGQCPAMSNSLGILCEVVSQDLTQFQFLLLTEVPLETFNQIQIVVSSL